MFQVLYYTGLIGSYVSEAENESFACGKWGVKNICCYILDARYIMNSETLFSSQTTLWVLLSLLFNEFGEGEQTSIGHGHGS